jgi:predicted RNA binding protein YcfA (HicA-like mRNA interferase family)
MAKGKKTKYGSLSWREYARLCESYGWYYSHSKGDHDYYRHPELEGLATVVVGKTYSKDLVRVNIKYLRYGRR